MSILRNKTSMILVLLLLLLSLLPIPIVSAWVWNPGVTFNCENQYWSTTTPLTVTNVSIDTHWISINGIGFNITYPGSNLWANISTITTYPKTDTGYIINWTQQKDTTIYSRYYINGLKPLYDYTVRNNATGDYPYTTNASGAFTFNSSSTSRNRQYSLIDEGIPAGLYVATTGSDTTGTGTLANPYATLQKAINRSTTSDDIYMRGGTYSPGQVTFINRSGVVGDWFTIQNYNNEVVIINGSHTTISSYLNATIEFKHCHYVRFTGININYSHRGGITIHQTPSESSYIRIDNCTIGNCSSFAIKSNYGSYIYIEYNKIYNNMNHNSGHDSSQETISFSNVDYGYVYRNTLNMNRCEQIDIKYGCTWVYIHHNTINNTAPRTLKLGTTYYCGGYGIYVDSIGGVNANISVYSNLVYGNNTGIAITNEADVGHYENISIYNNVVNITNPNGPKSGLVSRGGIFIVRGDSGDDSTEINKDIKIYMNTVNLGIGNYYQVLMVGASSHAMQKNYMRRLNITNNIFTDYNRTDGAFNSAIVGFYGMNSTDGTTYFKLNNNLYNNSLSGSTMRIRFNDSSYTKTSTTQWGNSPLFVVPEYTDPHPLNPYLNITSPAIGSATSSLVASTDYAGFTRPQGGTYDRGALEYVGYSIPSFILSSESPVNTSTGVGLTPTLSIHVHETHGYKFNYTIAENHSVPGVWTNLVTGNDQTNGTFTHVYHPATDYSTKYWWRVTALNGTTWGNATYYFTTLAPATPSFVISGIAPVNESTGVSLTPMLDFTINELHGYLFNWLLLENSTGVWVMISTATDQPNATWGQLATWATLYSHTYYWQLYVWNTTTSHQETYHFTTMAAPAVTGVTLNNVHANWTTTSSINITWDKGVGATNTYIYRKMNSYPTSYADPLAVWVYSGTETYFNDTVLDPALRYYYALFPYNTPATFYGAQHNASLAETDTTSSSYTGSSWLDFQGWMDTDKSIQTRFQFAEDILFTGVELNVSELQVGYSTTGLTGSPYDEVYNLHKRGQSLLTGADDFYITNITVELLRPSGHMPTGAIYVKLYAADATWKPTGSALSQGFHSGYDLPEGTSTWFNISMSNYHVHAATRYVIVLSSWSGSFNCLEWNYASPPLYSNGNALYSNDDGATWANWSTNDFLFKIWGTEPATGGTTSNTTLSSSGTFDILQESLNPGQLYYYRITANDTKSNMTRGNVRFTLTNPVAPIFLYMSPYFTNNSIHITWLKGTGANRTVIVDGGTSYPSDPSDGTILYNGTGTSVWYTGISFNTTHKISLFSFTIWSTLSRWSSPVTIPWGGCTFIVHNESKPWQTIRADIMVTDSNGLHPSYFNNTYGYYSFNISSIPYGENTRFYITNGSGKFQARLYVYTLEAGVFYNFSFYLPRVTVPGNGTFNTSAYYNIQIINEMNYPVNGALVRFYKYMNYTTNYTYIGGFVSDGNGEGNIPLFPYNLYMVKISAAGYENATEFWSPNVYEQSKIKVFKLYISTDIPETSLLWGEEHSFDGYLNNATSTLYVNYTDDLAQTIDWTVYIWRINNDSSDTLIATYSGTNDTFQLARIVDNRFDYHVLIWVNHTTFGRVFDEFTTYGYHYHPSGKAAKFNLLMRLNFGWNPFGWANTAGLFIFIACLFSFGRRESFLSALLVGGILLFLDVYIGFPTIWNALASGFFPVLIIFIGVLMMIRDRGMYGSP